MTQTTDKNRAEFLAWVRTHEECHGAIDEGSAWAAWQAARRAQVVPEGWKLVPVEPSKQMRYDAQKASMDHSPHSEWIKDEWPDVKRIWKAMLAAAPQPAEALPAFQTEAVEAAPVQLQESISKVLEDCRSRAIDYATCPSPYNNTRMETAFQSLEHQVRQLLAAHGIGKDKA